jgi:hypothetical protein
MERGRNDLEAKVFSFYDARWNLSSELHRNLAKLPFYFTIMSTPDNMLCEALRGEDKEPVIECYNFRGENPEMVQMGTQKNPLVFYLYGTIDEPESLVLTENNLIDFLAAVIAKNPPLPRNILSELRNKNKSLLFLGFGFKHWYLRILLHVLQGRDKESRSFALEQFTPRNIEEFQRTILFFRTSDYKIQICEMGLKNFVRDLRERYEKRIADKASKVLLQDAPTVFFCFSEQNRNLAESLRDQLNDEGFKVWINEDGHQITEEVIKNEIDYFVVLQSQDMIAKFEPSYDQRRKQQQKDELQQKWELLSQKLSGLEKERILETRPDEKFRLENLIAETRDERQHIEQQLVHIETPVPQEDDKQGQGTFKREIQLALGRQKDFPLGIRFIIPVKIEDCPVLEELRPFPTVNLSDKENVRKLISAMRRDQQRRRRK